MENKKGLGFENTNTDDDLNRLLSSSSSAADALNALSYDKDAHSLTGTNDKEEEPAPIEERIVEEAEPEVAADEVSAADEAEAEPAQDEIIDDLNVTLSEEMKPDTRFSEGGIIDDLDDEDKPLDNDTIKDDLLFEDDEAEENVKIFGDAPAVPIPKEDALPESDELPLDKPASLPQKPVNTEAKKTAVPAAEKKPAPQKKTKSSGKSKKKKKKSKVNNSIFTGIIITIIILTVSTVIAFTGITVGLEFLGVGKSSSAVKLNIGEDYTIDDIADTLYDNGIINSKFLFKLCVSIKDAEDKIVPGDIELEPSSSYNDKINTLMSSRQTLETVDVTFPEGTNLYEAAQLLKENGVINSLTDFIYDFNSLKLGYDYEDVIDSKGDKFFAMEGYFYPDTYQFYKDSDNETVIRKLREAFDSKVTDEMKARAEELGYTLDEVITLASIVQLESASTEEMPTIASVFINRLKYQDGSENQFGEYISKLQSDPTSNYYTDVITTAVADLKNYTTEEAEAFKEKYDTYERTGLPVGPICNPGIDAINAVLYADDTEYFYFCHDLNTKQAYFASTYSEHEANLVTAGLA